MKGLSLLILSGALAACGGKKPVEERPEPVIEVIVEQAPPPPPRYVIVHRNTPIRLTPDRDASFLQYRTPKRQKAVDKRRETAAAERAEQADEAKVARLEKEKKRRDRSRKRRRKYSRKRRAELADKDKERAELRRVQRAERKLREIRRRGTKDRLGGPDRPWIPFELVKEKGGWLQLSPVSRQSEIPHCYARNFGEVDRLAATFWVRKDDVELVTTRSVRIAPAQGTEVILKPGVALRAVASSTDRYEVFVDGFVLELTVPENAVGTTYEPSRPFEAPRTDMVFTPIALANGRLKLSRALPLPYNPYRGLFLTGTLQVGAIFYVTTQTPCGEYTMRSHPDHVEPVGKRGVTRFSGGEDVVKPPMAKAGAMSHLPDGEPFARVRVDFPLGVETEKSGERTCYRSAVWGTSDAAVSRSLELCFAPRDLVLESAK